MVGSFVSLSLNIHQTRPVGVSNAVYIVFIILHASAFFIAMVFIVYPKDVVRKDGTHIATSRDTKVWYEIKETVKVMTTRKYLIMAPAQLGCEMGLALVSSVNGMSRLRPSIGKSRWLTAHKVASSIGEPDLSTTLHTRQYKYSCLAYRSAFWAAASSSPVAIVVLSAWASWAQSPSLVVLAS